MAEKSAAGGPPLGLLYIKLEPKLRAEYIQRLYYSVEREREQWHSRALLSVAQQ